MNDKPLNMHARGVKEHNFLYDRVTEVILFANTYNKIQP